MSTATTDQTVLYELKYSQLFELLAQQQNVRIASSFSQRNFRGSKGAQVVKQIGALDPDLRTTRGEPIEFSEVPHDARWCYPQFFDKAVMFDTWDELQTQADPRSEYARALLAGMNRKKDTIALTALFADAKTGETGADTTSYDTANEVAVDFDSTGTNTYLTLGKIQKGVELLLGNEVDLDMEGQIHVSARAKDIRNLMKEIQVVNTQYGAGSGQDGQPVLKEGKLIEVYGCRVIHTERHQTSGSNTWCGMWVPGGMAFGIWQDVETKITQRTDLRGQPWQVYVSGFFGSTRLQEKKVIRLLSITT